jgi:ATP sulfurylase
MSQEVQVLEHKQKLSLFDSIRFQITYHSFINKLRLSPAQMDTLAYLALWGEINMSDFCEQIVNEELFTSAQTVRNFITKQIKEGVIIRKGLGNKLIELSPTWDVISSGSSLIVIKTLYVETNQG